MERSHLRRAEWSVVYAGDDGAARWSAHGRFGEKTGVANPIFRKLVEIRSVCVFIPVATKLAADVFGCDPEDIRAILGVGEREKEKSGEKQKEETKWHSDTLGTFSRVGERTPSYNGKSGRMGVFRFLRKIQSGPSSNLWNSISVT